MWKFLIIVGIFGFAFATITLPLFRQKTPRQHAMSARKYPSLYNIIKAHVKNDSEAISRHLDSEFYTVVRIGSPSVAFNLLVDTSWGSSWVMSSQCSTFTIGCRFHDKYDHSKSHSYVENGTKFNANEGSYNLTGFLSVDNFIFAHVNVTNQTFVEMTSVPWFDMFSKADGVLGLAYSTLSETGNPVFYNLVQQGSVERAVFSIFLNRDHQSDHGGSLIFGGIDRKHVKRNETFVYLPITTFGYWQFKMDGIMLEINVNKTTRYCNGGCQAFVDSSTITITGPKAEIDDINKKIGAYKFGGLARYWVPCGKIMKLPLIHFVLGGKNFTLHGRDYIQQLPYYGFTLCLSAFISPKASSEVWVLGASFLSTYYSVYDLENNKIGFVKTPGT